MQIPMNKHEFVMQYVLTRASVITSDFNGAGAMTAALEAWEVYQEDRDKNNNKG